MSQQNITLRPAEATRLDGLAFARYLDEAAEGFFGLMLGRNAAEIIAGAFVQPAHDLSYENVEFAVREGDIVGMVSGYTGRQHRDSSDRPLREAAGGRAFRMRCVKALLRPLWRIIDTVPPDDFYLQAIAVDCDARGQGVGSLLMNAIEERARESASARLTLDVGARNKNAQRLYARFGMTAVSQWPSLPVVPPLFIRMSKQLSAERSVQGPSDQDRHAADRAGDETC